MRILAIRGRNLASLAGDFVVDFEAKPLAEAGIFAITGPTGAGKSTLLDAMCLALFNTLPRLLLAQASARIETGQGDELAADDPRLILRHGAGEGFAEVDFMARNGVPYRARWSVQRAHRKPKGRLQSHSHSFERLDTGERLGGTRTETLAEIRKVVGLTADQFRRAVLLAQGDFDAFIRADANERALLLERLTGSGIYARLGAAAFEKAAQRKQQLQALEGQIAAQNGLDDAARAALEAELSQLRAEVAQAAQELAVLGEARRWWERRQELAQLLAQAETDLQRARQAQAEAEERRQTLARRRQAFEVVPLWQDLAQQREALAAASLRAQECAQAVAQAASDVVRAEAALKEAEQALTAVQAEATELEPEIAEARRLDQRLADIDRALAPLLESRARHERDVQSAEKEALATDAALQTAETERAAHAAWLEAHRHLARWEAQEDDLLKQLKAHANVLARLVGAETEHAEAAAASTGAMARLAEADAALRCAETQQREAEDAVAQARESAPDEEAFAALLERRSGLQALQGLLANWRAALVRATDAAGQHARLLEAVQTAAHELKATEILQADIASELPVLQGRLEEARRALRLAEAASGSHAALMREALQDGEPCPVCGSTKHEVSALDVYLGEQIEAARKRTQDLETEVANRQQELAGLAERLKQTILRQKEAQHQAEVQAGVAEEARREAEALGQDAGKAAKILWLEGSAETLASLITAQLADAEAACDVAVEARKQLAAAEQAEKTARARLEAVRTAQQQAAEACRQTIQKQERLQEMVAWLTDERQRLVSALDGALADHLDWQELADAGAVVREQIGNWRSHDAACRDADAALPMLRQRLADGRTAVAKAQALLEAVRQQCATAETERDCLRVERSGLLEGRAVADVVARLAEARHTAESRLEAARATQSRALQSQAEVLTRQQEVARRCGELEQEVGQRISDLTVRLGEAGLTEAEVAGAATVGREALQREAEALAEIAASVIRAQAAVASRSDDTQRHEAADRPEQSDEELAAAVAEQTDALHGVQERLKMLEFDLRRDDDVRAQTTVLRDALERTRAEARPWLELNEVIGDKEGKVFRRFAQGLTLDRLLEHANARLAELSPRYALERGQGGDMMIQVIDHDMAGEVRGVHNLSGGERFLVSLALALGLAEMSTGRGLRVESLFIDEGFGALDSASLGQALSVLEHLHASGRRVGVISHIEEVKERIPVQVMVTPISKGRSRVEVGSG